MAGILPTDAITGDVLVLNFALQCLFLYLRITKQRAALSTEVVVVEFVPGIEQGDVGAGCRISACSLVGVAHSLAAHDLRHNFEPCMNVISDMTGGSRGIGVPSSQSQCCCWVGGLSRDTLLLSPFPAYILCTQFIMNGHVPADCPRWFLQPKITITSPPP